MIRPTLTVASAVAIAIGAIAIGAPPTQKPESSVAGDAPTAVRPSYTILSANYRCRLEGDDLVGTAEWSIRKSVAGPESMSLGPLSFAIRRAHWIDKRPAVITSKPGAASSELLVERTGDSQIQLDWSARGVREPAGLRIPIRTPASPIAAMTLELPSDLQPRLNADQAILSGPTSDNGRFLWTITFGGSDFLDLHLVSRAAGEPLPIMISRQRNRHTIAVGQIASEFTVELESFNRGIRELKFHCDPGFQPTEATARNLADWHFDSSGELTLSWQEPFGGSTIVIRGIGSLPENRDWLIPGLKVRGAASMGETLTLQSAPDIALSDCRPGSFRIVESVAPPDRAGSFIFLQRGIFQNAVTRPTVRMRVAEAAFRTHEHFWWRLDSVNESLVAQVSVEALRGVIADSRWRVPPNFTVERVDAEQPDALGAWRVVDDILIVDWQRILTVDRLGRLTIQLTSRKREPSAVFDNIAVPDLVPVGSTQRTGRMAIKTPPNVRPIAESASVAPSPSDDRESSPWGPADPDLILPLMPGNRIQLQPRPSDLKCQAICRISPMRDSVAVTYRLHIEPHETPIPNLLLRCPDGCDSLRDWRVVQGRATIQSVDRLGWQTRFLAWAATDSIWSALVPSAFHDEWSRISFSGPVAEPFDLECRSTLPPLNIPLFELVGSSESAWQTTIDSASGSQWDLRSASGRPLWRLPDSNGHRSFRSEPDVLAVFSRSNLGPILEDMRLTVDASQSGRLSYALRFGVSDWNRGELPLTLPESAHNVAIAINGMTAAVEPVRLADGRMQINLPARSVDRWTAEIRYSTPADSARFWERMSARLPTADFDLPPPRTAWILPAGWIPARPNSFVESSQSVIANGILEGPTRWIAANTTVQPSIEIIRPSGIQRFCLAIAAMVIACCGLAPDRMAARIGVVIGGLLAFTAIWLPAPSHQFCSAPLVACAILTLRPHLAELARGRISLLGRPRIGTATAFILLALAGWAAINGAAAARSVTPISSGPVQINRAAAMMSPSAQDRHLASPRKPAVPEPEFRIATLDYWSVEIGNGTWVHQLMGLVDAPAPVSIALVWPQTVEVLSLAVDDESLVISEKSTSRIEAPLDRRRLNGTLVCVWRTQENPGEVRSRLPRIDSERRSMSIDTANWRMMPLPGRAIEGAQASSVDMGRSDPRSATARLQFVDRFADRSRPVFAVNGLPNAVTIVDPASADYSTSAIRTSLLLAFLAVVAAFSRYVRPLEALETVAALAIVAAIMMWEWPWLLPAALVLALRAASFVFSRRYVPRSTV